MARVNFDHQGGTPLLPEALEAMQPWLAFPPNAGGFHREALAARAALLKAREQLAAFLHAESPEQIILTSSGTEAVNLAVKGAAWASQRLGNHVVYSAIEHPAVAQSIEFLLQHGFTATKISVDAEGRVDPAAVEGALTDKTSLICVHHANHDIGTIEPVERIGEIAQERGIPLFVDAVASAGWLPIDAPRIGASLVAVSAARFGGPRGVGALYRHRRARLAPLIHGGNQEGARRAGAENLAAIAGAGAAAQAVGKNVAARADQTGQLQAALWEDLRAAIPNIRLNGPAPGRERLPNNLNFSVENAEGEGLAIALDMLGFAVASGSSCLGKSIKLPPVLEAIGCPASFALGNLIVTLDPSNTLEEVARFIRALPEAAAKLRLSS